jgi:hypothetical protein
MKKFLLIALAVIFLPCASALTWHFGPNDYLVAATPKHLLFILKEDSRFAAVQDKTDLSAFLPKLTKGLVFAWALEGYSESHEGLLNANDATLNQLLSKYPLRNYLYDLSTGIHDEITLRRVKLVTDSASMTPLNVPERSANALAINKVTKNLPYLKVRMLRFSPKNILVDYCHEMTSNSAGTVVKKFNTVHLAATQIKLPLPFGNYDVLDAVTKKLVPFAKASHPHLGFYEAPNRLDSAYWPHAYPINVETNVLELQTYLRDYAGMGGSTPVYVKKKMKLSVDQNQNYSLEILD